MTHTSLCAIHQPNFFPRLSTLAKLYAADTWVVLDDVQFTARDYQHRARLGRVDDPMQQQWLTLSVHRPAGRATRLDQVRLADQRRCQLRVAGLFQQYYGRSRYWPAFREALEPVLTRMAETDRLADIAEASTRLLLQYVGWPGTVLRSSDLPARSGRSERLADLATAAGSQSYLCGTGGRRYLEVSLFAERGVVVEWFEPPAADDGEACADVWNLARRISATRALMVAGPQRLRDELSAARQRRM